MKYTLFFLIVLLSCGCEIKTAESKNHNKLERQENKVNIKPKFEDYLIENVLTKIDNQTLDKIYNKNKSHFSQFYYDRNGLEEYCQIFAGKYIAIDMLQGSETVCTYIFDSSTGKMYESPLFIYNSEYKSNSKLFIKDSKLNDNQKEECKESPFDCSTKYYLWHEEDKEFRLIK
ncbi:MAG: hypothetical protein V4622_08455 [Bacteroidota bacterium]